MNTTVDQLKTWYSSMRTMMGRLKKRAKKSGSGALADDMNSTEKWVWDKFTFLIPHIETVGPRNVCSFAAASSCSSELSLSTKQSSSDLSNSSRVSTPAPQSDTPRVSQSGSDGCLRERDERVSSTEMKKLLVEFMSRSAASCGSSYFGRYVDETLSKLPGEIRREAEMNIMQELHRAQRAGENNQRQSQSSQGEQAQSDFCQQQFQKTQWQPPPSQWPIRPVGPQTSVWGSQDRTYIQRQFPAIPITCPVPQTRSQLRPVNSTTITTASTVPVLTAEQESFVNLLSTQLNTPEGAQENDESGIYHT